MYNWKTAFTLPLGSVFQAMVSVMAVKIQFSSPNIVLLSFNIPGTLYKQLQNYITGYYSFQGFWYISQFHLPIDKYM